MPALPLMIQGTASNVGKSALVTGLCRVLTRRGLLTAPFKPQNMALNSAVTVDGGEIGRAQALQAQACGLLPQIDMNPVLLKPNTACGAQVIVQGRVRENNMDAASYHVYKKQILSVVLESYQRLAAKFDFILIEGAGSPAEINLRDGDIANMGFAREINCPVILVADIDRGGVFAHLCGTLRLLEADEQKLVKGFVINKFRGDLNILKPGIDWLEQDTGKRVIGVLPYLSNLYLDAEDSLSNVVGSVHEDDCDSRLKVAVIRFPRISNQTDFEAMAVHPQVEVRFVEKGQALMPADLVILPGSKNVRDDLLWLKAQNLDTEILRHLRYGGKVIGICGGFQMMGNLIHDPSGIESDPGSTSGLSILDMETTISERKQLTQVSGKLMIGDVPVSGYEIHMGVSSGKSLERHAVSFGDHKDGAISEDDQVLGTYLHGVFDRPEALSAFLQWSGIKSAKTSDFRKIREASIDLLADNIEDCLDLEFLSGILGSCSLARV